MLRRILALSALALSSARAAEPGSVLEAMHRANRYFEQEWPDTGKPIVTNRSRPSNIWTRGVYYEGLMALYAVDPTPADLKYAVSWGEVHHWGLRSGPASRSADDQCCGQTYLDLYLLSANPERKTQIQASLTAMAESPGREDWTWIDAIQMALPAFVKMGAITGDPKFFVTGHELFLAARDGAGKIPPLYNPRDGLWWRDASFVPPYRTPAGRQSYWSRGNGWVMAAMVRAIDGLPVGAPGRADYVAMLQQMARAVKAVQRADGFWNASLDDPADFGGKESSGTALFTYGLAGGIRLGVLPAAEYGPAAERGWQALVTAALHPDGFLGYVQGTGKQPSEGQPVTWDHRPDFDDFGVGCFLLAGSEIYRLAQVPAEWIDRDTGHRVVRLSREPGTQSLYFNLNPYTPDGRALIVTSPHGISTINLQTRAIRVAVPLGPDDHIAVVGIGHRTGRLFYTRREGEATALFAADLGTGISQRLAAVPHRGGIATINADETLAAGTVVEGPPGAGPYGAPANGPEGDGRAANRVVPATGPDGRRLTYAEQKEVNMNRRLEARRPMRIFSLNLVTGEDRTLVASTDWLNHLQFSPTDPAMLMYCHEGNWHKVDRIWLIQTDGTGQLKVHTRTMNMEIAGHEWWAADGQSLWYDLQTPRGEDFWVAGYNLARGSRTWFHLQRNEWSVHFNRSADGSMFAGDGGDSEMAAHAPDGKWIYLFRPRRIPDVAGISAPNAADLINPGVFDSERLVNMSRHDYRLEPNVTFTPDQKWVVFRSNLLGPVHVFAVEIAKAPIRAGTSPTP